MAITRQHEWARESSRRTRCDSCGLVAHSKRSTADGGPYTLWILGDASWDSRAQRVTPPCPPLGAP